MKEWGLKQVLFFIALSALSTPGYSVQFMNENCPKKFIGQVSEIREPEAAIGRMSRDTVVFTVKEKIKGDVSDQEEIELLKYGPIKVKTGADYVVHVDNGSICVLKEI
ncbi:MAG: hypothetical protein JNM93_05445 [Bacteriovoracaceae bacterium]|nr:hypothetical protein [Bacteriovoracaceae bacterium]